MLPSIASYIFGGNVCEPDAKAKHTKAHLSEIPNKLNFRRRISVILPRVFDTFMFR